MRYYNKNQVIIFLILLLMIGTSFTQMSSSNTLSSLDELGEKIIDGQILFPPLYSSTTYLIDSTGALNHTWTSSYLPGVSVWWLGDGTILRTIRVGVGPGTGGTGGGVQLLQCTRCRTDHAGVFARRGGSGVQGRTGRP